MLLDAPIKQVGSHEVAVTLTRNVKATVTVEVQSRRQPRNNVATDEEYEAAIKAAEQELNQAQTAEDIRSTWKKYSSMPRPPHPRAACSPA